MGKTIIESNRYYTKERVNLEFDKLFDEMIKYNKVIEQREKEIIRIEKSRFELARGYAKELGILINKKRKSKENMQERIMEMRKLLLFIKYKGNTQDKVKEYLDFVKEK